MPRARAIDGASTGRLATAAGLIGVAAIAGGGCQTPTSMTFRITTDAPECDGSREVFVTIARETTVERDPSSSKTCASREVGTIVALPTGDDDEVEVAFQASFSVGSVTDTCASEGPGCIVARRRLRFLAGEALVVEVPLSAACAGVVCPEGATCVVDDGAPVCRSSSIDPSRCAALTCGVGDLGNDGGEETGPASSVAASGSTGTGGSSTSSDATTGTAGGEGGAGGAGGTGGAGGSGGGDPGPTCGALQRPRLGRAERSTCVVLDDGTGRVACTGALHAAGDPGGFTLLRGQDGEELTCVVHLEGGGDTLCAVVDPEAGPGCTAPGVVCHVSGGTFSQLTPAQIAVPSATFTCAFDAPSGSGGCSPPIELSAVGQLAPLAGGAGNFADGCVWSEDGVACIGATSVLADLVPSRPCVVDVDVGDAFACLSTGGSTVECVGAFAGADLRAPVVELGAGKGHVCARTAEGEVLCWGDGQLGQLGNGADGGSDAPVLAALGSLTAIAVETGTNHTCALTVDGAGAERLACWGSNTDAQVCGSCGPIVTQPYVQLVPTFP